MKKSVFISAMAVLLAVLPVVSRADVIRKTSGKTVKTLVLPKKVAQRAVEAQPFSLPLSLEPTQGEFERFIILDANEDDKTWKYMSAGYIKYDYNKDKDGDDWVFIPFMLVDTDNYLKLSVESRVQSSTFKESFEVAWGTAPSPDAMTVVIDADDISNVQWEKSETLFSIADQGVHYIGIHANSIKDQYGLWVRNISVEAMNTPVPLSPMIESSIVESLVYRASVRIPSETLQGKPIEGNVGLSVAVDGVEELDYSDCVAGSLRDVNLSLSKGSHEITYSAYLMVNGEKSQGQPVTEVVRAVSDEAMTLPFFMQPSPDEFEQDCFVADANNDGNTWFYSSSEQALQYTYNSNQADDWVFLPFIDFGTGGGAFDISVDAKVASAYSPESFEVCVGRAANPSDMTPMLTCTGITNTIWNTYSGKITVSEGGKWIVGIHCISDANQWNLNIANINITAAADNTPAIPELKSIELDGLSGKIIYTLPSLTVENKPLSMPVGLIVGVDGVELTRTEPAEAGSDVEVPVNFSIGRHVVTASAFIADGDDIIEGSPLITNIVANHYDGYIYPLPFSMRPSSGEFEILVTLDANSSGINWDYNSGADNGKGALVCRTKDGKESDAWVFFPKVAVTDAGRIYKISASARAYLEQFPEDFDICIGTEADPGSMTVVLSERGVKSYLYEEFSGEYIAPAAGNYVIGIHRVSGGSAHTLSVYDVKMEDSGKSANAPDVVTALSATANPSGALSATLTFTMPVNGISGAPIDASTMLTATATSTAGDVQTVTGHPGETVSVTVGARQGVTEFEVKVSSETDGEGKAVTVSAYCGFDKPGSPRVTSAGSEDNMSLTVSWTDASVGANGGAVDISSLSHRIYVPTDATGEYWNLVAEVPAGISTYVYDVSAYALQDVTFVGVMAVNDRGTSELGLTYDVLGTPYPLPMTDDFSTGRYLYSPIVTPTPDDNYSDNWFFDNPGLLIPALANKDVMALFCINTPDSHFDYARLSLPKFSTSGIPAGRLTLTVYAAATTPRAKVYADTYGQKGILVGEIDARSGDDWTDVSFDLPAEMLGKAWTNIYIEVIFGEGSEVFILKGYTVRDVFEKQLVTTITAPEEIQLGETGSITGSVTNRSETAQQLPQVRFTIDGENLSMTSTPATETIAPGETVGYACEITPVAEMTGSHTVRFELVDYTDEVPDDNVAETEVTITAGNHPVVLDLSGEEEAAGDLMLRWTAPEIKHSGDDDIESYDAFDYSENIGSWLNIDRDRADVYGVGNNVSFPGQFQPKAFQVIDTSELPVGVVPPAFSGSKYFMVITPEECQADDWLISPEIVGGSKVSFRMNILSEQYGAESIDVLCSSTGRDPGDFTLVQTFSQARIAWNPLEVTLPADARYFAFHYRCNDIFGLCLDDIFYTPVTDNEIAGYNIYCNGTMIAEMHPETTYRHSEAKNGDKFNVTVVTNAGNELTEHPMSNTFIAQMSGIDTAVTSSSRVTAGKGVITITGFEGETVRVYLSDGKLMATVPNLPAVGTITLQPGIYIVSISHNPAVHKVVVK